eukprot:gene29518-36770_t
MDPESCEQIRELKKDVDEGLISQSDFEDLRNIIVNRVKAKALNTEAPSKANPKECETEVNEILEVISTDTSLSGSGLEKRQATLQIGLRAGVDDLGNNLPQPPIAIIFRGTGKRISEAEKRAYDPRVLVYFQKCAWVDRTTAIEWQNGTLIPWLNEHIPHEESGAGREVKHDVDYEDEWLEDGENLQKWENNELTASDRRILMTWW